MRPAHNFKYEWLVRPMGAGFAVILWLRVVFDDGSPSAFRTSCIGRGDGVTVEAAMHSLEVRLGEEMAT